MAATAGDRFRVPAGLYWQTRLARAWAPLWVRLARLESRVLELDDRAPRAPVYVTGLARAGTTIVTELLSRHPELTCHRYSDFPWIYTPYWRNWLLQRSRIGVPRPVERTHRDRIMVTLDSPEAVEEVLWRHFLPRFGAGSDALDESHACEAFETFYRDHISKLLSIRGRARYLAKGNYNVSRIRYLKKLFPDARFLIMVREPSRHVASLMKQQRLFCEGLKNNPRAGFQLDASGHNEFGPHRRAIDFGDSAQLERIRSDWASGREARGWARYWTSVYAHVHSLRQSAEMADSVLVLRYEDLCADSGAAIDRILEHCSLDRAGFESARQEYVGKLSEPDYYRAEFSPEEMQHIQDCTVALARAFGY